jgi:aspartate kinase
MKLVMKFGGSSLTSGESIRYVADLVAKYASTNSVVVIASALKGLTDRLIDASEAAGKGDVEHVGGFVKELGERHSSAIRGAIRDGAIQEEASEHVKDMIRELEQVLMGIARLGELTPRSKDYVLSFGERLTTSILAASMKDAKLKVRYLTGGEAGIVTDDNFGEANPLLELTKYQVKTKLDPLLEQDVIPVVTGFIAATQEGVVSTLGRGGSDYTATLIATAIGADEVWIWTDVDGLMTADPKAVPSARVIPELSYMEAAEMSILGAKYMHPRALEPVMEAEIPVRIRSIFNVGNPGTLIVKEPSVRTANVVKAVTLIKDVALINVSGFGMIGAPGTAAKVFDVLGKNNINILMISQSVSEANISFVVRRHHVERALSALETSLLGSGLVRKITAEDDISVIAAVGTGMKGTPGIAAKVFGAIAKRGINVRMIAQGSSELNISFVVKEEDCEEAIRAVHEEFALDKLQELS